MGDYFVYKLCNDINGKVYIGKSAQPIEDMRFGWGGVGYRDNIVFYTDIKKYGWNNFTCTIIADCLTADEADRIETNETIKHKSTLPQFGYNKIAGKQKATSI